MDIKKFKASASRKKRSLTQFLNKLDVIVPENLPELVTATDSQVWQAINCKDCANCCKTMTPTYKAKDIKRIATHLNLTPTEFKKRWLKKETETQDWVNTTQPCQFLEDNICTIYEVRPLDCAEFPHHNKKPFDAYNDTFKGNLTHCPATLSLIDKLKKTVEKEYIW